MIKESKDMPVKSLESLDILIDCPKKDSGVYSFIADSYDKLTHIHYSVSIKIPLSGAIFVSKLISSLY